MPGTAARRFPAGVRPFSELPADGAHGSGPLGDELPALLFACAGDASGAYLNREWLRYTGLNDLQELAARWDEVTVPGDPSPLAPVEGVAGDETREVPFRLRDAQGRFRRLVARVRTLPGAAQAPSWTVGAVHEPPAGQDELQALVANRNEFLAMVSHELRSPLNAIRGWAQVLRVRGDLSPAQLQPLAAIERNVTAQARLIDDLLDSRRLLQGDAALDRRRVPVAALVDAAVEMLRPAADDRHQTMMVHPVDESVAVDVDADRLQQVLVNLLSNAVKFTPPEGRIDVTAGRRGDVVAIEVRDTGLGLTQQWARQVFEPFRQGETPDGGRGGLGLGLTLARRIVEMHGGRLGAASDGPGRGATFVVELPLAQGP